MFATVNITIENIVLIGSLLLLISILVGKTSFKFGIPTLLLFLTIGMLAGSEGLGGIYFDNPQIAQFIGIVSLNFILFSGGLDTSWSTVKPVLRVGLALSTFGVLLTALGLGYFVFLVTDFTIYESLLLGAIVSSTDAAAVFSILRGKNLALKKNLRPTLELESGSNDPMAYVLTIAFLGMVVEPEKSLWSLLPLFFMQMAIGAGAGFLFGKISKWVINNIRLDFEGLYPVLVIALMFITYSTTDAIGGNGFLAIYLCSVYLGNQNLIHKKTILGMFDGLAWLMQIVLFLTLGLLVFPSQIIPYIGIGLLISIFLIFVARPLAVFVSLLPFKMKLQRRFYISWVGLRGAVPIVFATYPLLAGIDKANIIFNIVFFISVSSVLLQGTTLGKVASWLGVGLPEEKKLSHPTDVLKANHPKAAMKEMLISEACPSVGKKIVDLKFPKNSIIALIERDGKYIMPNDTSVIHADDKLVILADSGENLEEVSMALQKS
ncbi:NhaP-type Na+(K+)/H+ antiporter [Owenweeksia hongkongensis DSM 17368]|uniref:NhaP-type Na+(K+)/H+ antiporter n=1 Tax=Owenweeksia hongkongensis (strain DSM 17368 / CIP 108786 / JCM 12287 / NRRL B-23963 / UST20020801) TaxID=926562 RepID=G8R5S3_OWEHD|nr:NhaP-type Na+(K+)/H+ antiporter [Owenweeksia hongkongensis DSM 17368]